MKEWIMDQWERNYYITALAGANNGSSLVVMSKGKAKACSSKAPFLLQKNSFDYLVNLPRHNVYATVLQS